jgi:hypothetical protein
MWMPHDDIFAPDWVPILANALASHPQAWLAFGRIRRVELDGVTPRAARAFPFPPGAISAATAVRMMAAGWGGYPFRGVFRRCEVLAAGLRLGAEPPWVAIDTDWVFRVALHSGLVYDDRAVTWKRGYPGSTSTTPEWQSQRRAHPHQAAITLLRRHGPTGRTGITLRAVARSTGLAALPRRQIVRVIPPSIKPTLREFLYRP